MTTHSDIISSKLIVILIIISLTAIFGCDGDDWSFDLFGGDSANGDDPTNPDDPPGPSSGDNKLGLFVVSIPEDGVSDEFPGAVFSAVTDDTKSNKPVELFSSFDDGSDITELTGIINRDGTGNVFKVSPDGKRVAYLSEENNEDDTETRIRELSSDDADVTEFDWSPDSSRIAYLAEDGSDGRVELYTNLAKGGDNRRVSGSLPRNGKVKAFEWSPNSELLAYSADQNKLGEFELFTTPPSERDPVRVSENVLPNNGDVTDFSWSPGSSRIAYLSDQRSAGFFQLFTSRARRSEDPELISEGISVQDFAWDPDDGDDMIAYSTEQKIFTAASDGGSSPEQVTPNPTINQEISDFSWAPNSSRIAYRANQRFDDFIELFTVEPDGDNNLRISGDLTDGGNVTDFSWSPDSKRIAYLADQITNEVFELFTVEPDDNDDLQVSGDLTDGGDVIDFSWSPDSKRVAYRANQRTADAIELFTSTPDGDENDRVSGDLAIGGNVGEFIWAPRDNSGDSPGIGYIADQETNNVFELFGSTPDGDEKVNLSGSFAEDEDGDVLLFEWVSESDSDDR
jgi:hypothetical protein